MDGIRQQLFIDYMYYLNETDRFYATKARYAKHVLDFLESASSVDRRGFMAFKREHSLEMANDYSCGTAICDFLNFCGKGYNRKKNHDIVLLADLLGHANMDTTRIYLQKSYEEQKASFTRSVSW